MIDIKRFSSKHRNQYYECDGTSRYALLKECPKEHFYWPQLEKCFREKKKTLNNRKLGFYAFDNGFVEEEKPEEQPQRMTRKVMIYLSLFDNSNS